MLENLLQNKAQKEILGLNRRNQLYIRRYNLSKSKNIADSKLLTKRMLTRLNIKTPELFKVIRTKKQLKLFDWNSLPKSFVLKPNQGTGGNGIIVFFGKKKGENAWIRPNGQAMTQKQINLHIENILEGRFSMGNVKDIALIEERLKNDKLLKQYSYKGVPDIRIIVFNMVPIMAELRLPTKESDGTANLHAGGIGVGIDMASGITTIGIHRRKFAVFDDLYDIIDRTQDLEVNLPLRGLKIPYWDEMLDIAIRCQKESGLGITGVDIALDRDKGPMVFEINARPGIAIQIANLSGLRSRMERVEGLKVKNVKHGIRLAKDLFGGEIEEHIEQLSGKQIVNLVEKIILHHLPKQKIKHKRNKIKIKQNQTMVKGMFDTGITTSRIDQGIASQIGYIDAILEYNKLKVPEKFASFQDAQEYINKHEHEIHLKNPLIIRFAKLVEGEDIKVKPVIKIKIEIRDELKEIEAIVSTQKDMLYPILIGRKEYSNYLIDPSKTFVK